MPFLLVCLVGLLVSVQASLASPPIVAGRVRLPDGSPVAGAQVMLFDVSDLSRGAVGQATTDEAGLFALPLAAGGALVLPQEVALGANYPNPFNPSTIIPYQLAVTSQVRLEVFNVLGQRVATLVDREQAAGAYRARWDGTDTSGGAAASGVYFYRLTVDGAHWTGKMVLVDGQAGVPLGGPSVEAVSLGEGSTATYGLAVSGEGLVPYVDADLGVAAGSLDVELAAPQGRGKVVATLEGMLGDVNTDGQVDLDDGLLVAMYSVDPGLALPNHGLIALGDVNCNGRVELADAGLIATYVAHPSAASVSSLRIGQRGGYSLDPVTEVVWGSILGTEQQDATVARILDGVPVVLSGVMAIDGEDFLFIGIDRTWWTQHGGKHIYEALKQRFPITPIHVEPNIGIVRPPPIPMRPPAPPARPPPRHTGPALSFTESPRRTIEDHTQQQRVVGQITVPEDVTVGTVSVGVEILHPSRGDLKIDLVAPSGVATTLYDGVQAGIHPEANLIDVLPATTALWGQAAQGVWQLRVGDYGRADAGRLQAWELTIIPTSDAQQTEDPPHLFLDTFEEGLNAWQTTAWEARSLDRDVQIPGEGTGNIVAQAQGCPVCFMTLTESIDLSAYESVTLSFYRWIDAGAGDHEFLGIDIGNNGAYQRLGNWGKQHADGQWHHETYTLDKDHISDAFTIRFFAIAGNAFTTFAVDNITITPGPGSVVVEPDETEDEEPTTTPDLAVTDVTITPTSVQPGGIVILRATVTNNGGAPARSKIVRTYRHTTKTTTPTVGGTRGSLTVTGTLAPNASKNVTMFNKVPVVLTPTTYYYYVCVDTVAEEQNTDDNCSATPAEVTVQTETEDEEEQEPETEQEPTTAPDLAVTGTTPPSISPQSGDTFSIQARVTNSGADDAPSASVRIYRHTAETSTPTVGGVRETGSALTGALAAGASVTVTSTHAAPTVSKITKYYYYICVDTVAGEQNTANNCSSVPAEVVVRITFEDPGPPYDCLDVPERSIPMGGDAVFVQPYNEEPFDVTRSSASCSTLTLGGLETTDGAKGFVISGHAVSGTFGGTSPFKGVDDPSSTNAFVGYGEEHFPGQRPAYLMTHLLGKVFRLPSERIEGDKKVVDADAAFVAYPHPKTPGCSLTWKDDYEEFCFDSGRDDYIERVAPLTIRGDGDTVYTVIGSKEPVEGLTVRFSGAPVGVSMNGTVSSNRLLFIGGIPTGDGEKYYDYVYDVSFDLTQSIPGGTSGAPIYTVPNAAGEVYIVGIASGASFSSRSAFITFNSWGDVTKGLDLKPVGQ